MSRATEYSVGVDVTGPRWSTATARDGSVSASFEPDGGPADLTSTMVVEERVASIVTQTVTRLGATPIAVVIALVSGQRTSLDGIAPAIASRLGLAADAVRIIDEAAARAIGQAFLDQAHVDGPGSSSDPGPSPLSPEHAVAIGAALSGDSNRDTFGAAPLLAAGGGAVVAAGAAGVLAGPAAETGALGPAGVPLAQGAAAVGPGGVPLSQGAGAAGPGGVPMGEGAGAGPTGVSFDAAGAATGPVGAPLAGVATRHVSRLAVIGGAVAAVVVATGVAVVAFGGGSDPVADPATDPATTAAVVVTDSAAITEPPQEIVTTIATPVTSAPLPDTVESVAVTTVAVAAATVPVPSSATCAIGSWLVDNDAYLAGIRAVTTGVPVTWDGISGAVTVDVAADGSVSTSYDAWTLTSTLGGAGQALSAVDGTDRTTVVFAEDGTYAVSGIEIGSQTKVSSQGFVIRDGPSTDTLFAAPGTYTCAGDQLVLVYPAATDYGAFGLTMTLTRNG